MPFGQPSTCQDRFPTKGADVEVVAVIGSTLIVQRRLEASNNQDMFGTNLASRNPRKRRGMAGARPSRKSQAHASHLKALPLRFYIWLFDICWGAQSCLGWWGPKLLGVGAEAAWHGGRSCLGVGAEAAWCGGRSC